MKGDKYKTEEILKQNIKANDDNQQIGKKNSLKVLTKQTNPWKINQKRKYK